MNDKVLQTLENGVLLLTLNRPDKINAFDTEQWIGLRDALEEASNNDEVAVVVITGAGGNFSSGVDLSDFANAGEDHPFESSARALAFFDKPLICAASGVAVGGGATLLFHADILYVGESLRMRLPFVNLGLVPEWASSYMLQANIGYRRSAEFFLTAEWIDSKRANEAGMVNGVFPDDQLLDKAMAKAREIAQWPVTALRETKRTLKAHQALHLEKAFQVEHEGMSKQAGSPENIEAVMAFLEKRPPDFKKLK